MTAEERARALADRAGVEEARGRLALSDRLSSQALAVLSSSHGASTLRARVWTQRGRARLGLGAITDARLAFERAIELAERAGSKDHVVAALNGLGVTLKQLGAFEEAEALYRRSLRMLRGRGRRAERAAVYHNLGGILHAQGRYAQAERYARRSVELRSAELGADHRDVNADRVALAVICVSLRRYDEAESTLRDSMVRAKAQLGLRHAEVAHILSNLAVLCHERDRLTEAETLYREAHQIGVRRLGLLHPEVGRNALNLGVLRLEIGDARDARRWFLRARRAFEATFGARDPRSRLAREQLRRAEAVHADPHRR